MWKETKGRMFFHHSEVIKLGMLTAFRLAVKFYRGLNVFVKHFWLLCRRHALDVKIR